MDRIKIMKRADLSLSLGELKTNQKPASPQIAERRAAQVVTNWIGEWRASQSKDARSDFDRLFRRSATITELVE